MSSLDQRKVFSVHSFTPYSRNTGEFYGIMKILGDVEFDLSASSVDLRGGSGKFIVDSEVVSQESNMTLSVKTLDDFMFEKYAGATVATTVAGASGTIGALANKTGVSMINATTGFASVAMTALKSADMKLGRYLLKATGAAAFDIYMSTDIDFKLNGADAEYQNALLKITPTPLTLPGTGGTVDATTVGLTFTGGSGAIAFVTGDTAVFDVVPPHSGISEITLGGATQEFPLHGGIFVASKKSDKSQFMIEAYKIKSSAGIVLPAPEGNFWIPNLSIKMLHDPDYDAVMKITAVTGTGA